MAPETDILDRLLARCVELGASDLHLSADEAPHVRCHGRLDPLDEPALDAASVRDCAYRLMHPRQQAVFEERQTLDLAYSLDGAARFRVNIFRERGRVALAIRRLEEEFRTLADWHLPADLAELAELRDGLVIVTGPTSSGKTTTLSTLVHQINLARACHIITIEDPVEYIHRNHRSLVRQRELYSDVPTFAEAVRAAMREDPNVILVGEMRDPETIRAAVTAAETGHLVFSTLHTGDAVGAVGRMIGVFSGEEQDAIRHQISMVLRAVVAQRLLPAADGEGRYPAVEILRATAAVANLIRTDKAQQIYSLMEAGARQGMRAMEQSLADLVASRRVVPEDASRVARDPQALDARLRLVRQAEGV